MIVSFRSKELTELFASGRSKLVSPAHQRRCLRLLGALDAAAQPQDMNVPGYDFHALSGNTPTRDTVHVNGPWCITFELPALNLQVKEAARHLGVTRQHLHRVLAEEADVSPDMAVRLGKFCGNGPHLWLAMQGALNLRRSTVKLSQELERIPTMNASKTSLESA